MALFLCILFPFSVFKRRKDKEQRNKESRRERYAYIYVCEYIYISRYIPPFQDIYIERENGPKERERIEIKTAFLRCFVLGVGYLRGAFFFSFLFVSLDIAKQCSV